MTDGRTSRPGADRCPRRPGGRRRHRRRDSRGRLPRRRPPSTRLTACAFERHFCRPNVHSATGRATVEHRRPPTPLSRPCTAVGPCASLTPSGVVGDSAWPRFSTPRQQCPTSSDSSRHVGYSRAREPQVKPWACLGGGPPASATYHHLPLDCPLTGGGRSTDDGIGRATDGVGGCRRRVADCGAGLQW